MAEVQTLDNAETRKLPVERYVVLSFFTTPTFLLCTGHCFLKKLWLVRLISERPIPEPKPAMILGGIDACGVAKPFIGWLGNEAVDISWEASRFLSPVTVLSHGGEFNKSKVM